MILNHFDTPNKVVLNDLWPLTKRSNFDTISTKNNISFSTQPDWIFPLNNEMYS